MKILTIFLLTFILEVSAQTSLSSWERMGFSYDQKKPSNQKQNQSNKTPIFQPLDPWRIIQGTTYYAMGTNWHQFTGKVLDVRPGYGIRVKGWYGRPGTFNPATARPFEFWVANFPYMAADNEELHASMRLVARESGLYTYRTVLGNDVTLRALDFGAITNAPSFTPSKSKPKK